MKAVSAKALYSVVASLGLTRAQVRKLLPAWWTPELESTDDGVAELAQHLSRRLSIDLQALLLGKVQPSGAVCNLAFKHNVNLASESLSAATFIASALADAVLPGMTVDYRPLPSNPFTMQEAIRSCANGVLSFEALLALCWQHGIPVIPLPHLPVGIRKMDGAVLQVHDRPVIVIAKKKSSKAWLSFILAHEMAHIALGHVSHGSAIVDVALQEATTYATDLSEDRQEVEADVFALSAIGGSAVAGEISSWASNFSPVEVAVRARQASIRSKIDAGHFVLRYAFEAKRWAVAMSALGFLREDLDPESVLLAYLKRNLDLGAVPEDLRDMVERVTGWTPSTTRTGG